jgi:hypothetical protein
MKNTNLRCSAQAGGIEVRKYIEGDHSGQGTCEINAGRRDSLVAYVPYKLQLFPLAVCQYTLQHTPPLLVRPFRILDRTMKNKIKK